MSCAAARRSRYAAPAPALPAPPSAPELVAGGERGGGRGWDWGRTYYYVREPLIFADENKTGQTKSGETQFKANNKRHVYYLTSIVFYIKKLISMASSGGR